MAPARTLYLYTPIPPISSGTADYADTLMQHVLPGIQERFRLVFAVESRQFAQVPRQLRGAPVVDFRAVAARPEDVCLYFIANNEFHRYALASLAKHRYGQPLTMIHDLGCMMNVTALCGLRQYGYTPERLAEHLETELGDKAAAYAQAVWAGRVPELFKFLALGQSVPVRRSSAILLHSYFARARLLLETRPELTVPPLYVVQHPHDAETSGHGVEGQAEDRFVVSTFGWVGPTKRTIPLIEAFARFRAALPADEQARVELRVIGKLPPVHYYDPVAAAERVGLGKRAQFFGYVTLTELERHMRESHIVFNLRFPSCGETSGTLRRCHYLGVPVVTTAYAAFHEEPADFRVSPDPDREVDEIQAIIRNAYEHFRRHGNTHALVQSEAASSKLPFWEAVLRATPSAAALREARREVA